MLVGVILSFHFALWITSLMLTTVASSVILVTFHAVFVGILGYYLLGETLSKKNIAGICIAFLGTAILVYGDFTPTEGDLLSQEAIIGDILAFLGGIMAGAYILAGRYFRRTRDLITYVFIVYSGCALSLLVMCIVTGTPFYYPPNEFLLFLLMAVGPGIMGHTLYNWALKYVKATVVSVSLLGEPIGSSLLAFILLNETPSSLVVMGGAAILIGIYMTAMGMEATESADRTKKGGGPVAKDEEEE
jgi:drug/metabolite transporter (DMT)-like permease